MSDETLELLWSMLTNEQLLELREKGAMDDRTAVAKAVMAAFMEGLT